MRAAHSSPTPRRPALPAFLGGGRPPGRALVCISSLRDLRRLLVLSLVGQLLIVVLLVALDRFGTRGPAQQCSGTLGTLEAPGRAVAPDEQGWKGGVRTGDGAPPAAAMTTPITAAAPNAAPQPRGSGAA
jgi:hypothetical protein